MRILVTGASGFIGSHIARALLAAGHEVVAGVRVPGRLPVRERCSALAVDFSRNLDAEDWLPQLAGIDAVVNCVGIIGEDRRNRFDDLHRRGPIALFEACQRAGVGKVIQVSALGADEAAFSRYHLSKKAADDALAAMDLDWAILQPSWVYGPGGKSLMLFAALAALPIVPLIGDGGQRLQPVHVDDLVAATLRLLEPGAPRRMRLAVVGPEPITLGGILAALRRWQGRTPTITVQVPFAWVCWIGDIVGARVATPLNGEALRMLRQGNTGDPAAIAALLGRPPRSLESALAQWPMGQAERWHAALFFLLPALRYALAALWVWSGLTSALWFPQAGSFALLSGVGITGAWATLALYGASALDVLLGAALLLRWRVRWVGAVQAGLMAVYSLIIGIALPEFLFHPYAPLVKNLPLMVATLMLMATEES